MFELYLPIFPEGGLANSITTTIWIGILVVAFFNLRFGWVLSGLVVPGYLVPLLLVKPIAVAVILVEASLTYFLMWFLSTYLSRIGFWSDFFGRDRFFAILILATIVRVIFDGFLLIEVGIYINETLGISFDYRNNLHSFGLIIVALIANLFWKPGFIRGTIPLFITILITYLITRYGLIEYTNFTLSNLSYLYEDISASILASPKAYIILLTTAFIASRMNLRYGWDYNGILIPALLALQWYQPSKILVSFLEAFIILFISALILKLPLFKNSSIEGAKKIILFFNVGFFYKFILSILIIKFFPEEKVSDYFAFGYLLSTLMAIKMYDKDIIVKFTRATIETSLYSVIIASIIGFSLSLIPNFLAKQESITENKNSIIYSDKKLYDLMLRDKINLYLGLQDNYFKQATTKELDIFKEAITIFKEQKEKEYAKASNLLSKINYKVEFVEDRYLYLSEITPKFGWGFFLIDTKVNSDLLLQVPAPLDEWSTFEIGYFFFDKLKVKTLAIAGTKKDGSFNNSSNVLSNRFTIYNEFCKIFNKQNSIQLRGFSSENLRKIEGLRKEDENKNIKSKVIIKESIPKDLDLTRINEWVKVDTIWNKNFFTNIQRDATNHGFIEMFLTKEDRRKLLALPLKSNMIIVEEDTKKIDGYLGDWMLTNKDSLIAKTYANSYKKPSLQEILFFDQEILTPLLSVINKWDKESIKELDDINSIATVIDYNIIKYKDILSKNEYIILYSKSKFWGTFIFKVGKTNNYLIQVPRPLYESNTFEYATTLFKRLNAQALIIAGTHPFSNSDGSSDIIKLENQESIFTLANQVILREKKEEEFLSIQIRAYGKKDIYSPNEDIILSFNDGKNSEERLNKLSKNLITNFKKENLNFSFVDGDIAKAGYEVGGIPQSLYLKQTINKEFAILWLAPEFRKSFARKDKEYLLVRELEAFDIKTSELSLFEYIKNRKISKKLLNRKKELLIKKYLTSLDIILLQDILSLDINLHRIIDIDTKKDFLIILDKNNHIFAVVNLSSKEFNKYNTLEINLKNITDFIDSQYGWMEFR